MIETINGKAYVKKGNKVYEVGGGSNIITADSVEQLPDPASVPEGTVAMVKSEGGGGSGLTVVELSTTLTADAVFTEEEQAILTAAHGSGTPFVIKCALNYQGQNMSQTNHVEVAADNLVAVANTISIGVEGSFMKCIFMPFVGSTVVIMNVGNGWGVTVD